MEDVGRMAGVSQVTVSRALSDPSKVSKATLERIRDAIERTGFVPNAAAGTLASSKSKLISALIPSLTNVTYTSFVKEFSVQLRQHGYQVLLSETGFGLEDEEEMISRHLSRRPDAMLLTGITHSQMARRMRLSAKIPVVELWDVTDSPIDVCVGFSHREAGRAVAEYVATLAPAHVACLIANDERARRRQAAFSEAITTRTGDHSALLILDDPASLAGGRQGLSRLIDEQGFERGLVFCSSDLLAQGVLLEAQVRGLSVPEDIAVIGFGDQDFSAHLHPPLTTVRLDRQKMGSVAADAIIQRLKGRAGANVVYDLGFEIVIRGTTE